MDIGTHVPGSVTSNVNGSPDLKEDRSGLPRSSKLSRTTTTAMAEEDKSLSSPYSKSLGFPLARSASDSLRQEHMLSFSDKPEAQDFSKYVCLDNKNSLSPFLHQFPPPQYRSYSGGGYGCGGMMMGMQGKGPFTLSQWAELEQQALIFKYITANVPVPSSLLISIQKSFYTYGSLPPTSFGWGAFHLGFAGGNMDPEPGRCRRTDGKKWRCSRDAVPDQKYCERHINRGRHRSRKLVEVQSNQTASAAAASKAVTTQQHSVVAGGINNRVQSQVYPSTVNLQPKESPKQRNNNSSYEFGHISSDSLLNPNSAKSLLGSTYLDFSSSQDKQHGNHSHSTWPEELKSDWTQLSMSIPVASSSPSSTHITGEDKTTLSPLRLSRESDLSEQETLKKVNTWIPISWGNSLGGPLGEVLNSTTNSPTLGSSPTGVLQKSTFCPLSNSNGSPIAESNNRNTGGDYFRYTT
ncbi:Growth-regulating factor 2 [Raphanus sativus]|uniref:Growth-regulating factor n=1 Tax=Raphanus sativus TaxID=3726 RepID=A0A9W3CKH1_RAPSA|nr:growth-regulating factor 2-like [Raphanus sativus]KAJ4873341.1 Growth-regulating factor 2 [Raphanus sativus]